MEGRILVAYASSKNTTAEVAEAIAKVLREPGIAVDVKPVEIANDLNPYRAVVLGSAVYLGQLRPQMVEYVKTHQETLNRLPVAFFTVSMTMRNNTPESRQTILGYLKPLLDLLPQVKAVDVGLFAGAFNPQKWPLPLRLLIQLRYKIPIGDFRKWDNIYDWTMHIEGSVLHPRASAAQ